MQEAIVAASGGTYSIRIARGLLGQLPQQMAHATCAPSAAAVVMDQAIAATHGAAALAALKGAGIRTVAMSMHASEADKTLATMERLCQAMLQAGLDRKSCVIALGGGIVGDTAGFAAACFMRGVALVQVPTTLLAMVDASIGGKTGVNVAREDGSLSKNMVGAFWQPRVVVCDPEVLRTLDPRELRCGLAECIKHAVLSDPSLLAWIESNAGALLAHDMRALEEVVARCAAIKAAVVTRDEREDGPRALLNLGHTFAHAIEALDHRHTKHGEAVAIGLVAAAQLARELGGGAPGSAALDISRLLSKLGLPVRLITPLSCDALMSAMRADKKAVGGALRMVVPYALGDVRVVEGVGDAAIRNAWRAVGAT